jgi:hypothetical protein
MFSFLKKQKITSYFDLFFRFFNSSEKIFTDIYNKNKWGGHEAYAFDSGLGSSNQELVDGYISKIRDFAMINNFSEMTFVDIGCGDFRVGNKLCALCRDYIGIDIVRPLIEYNSENFSRDNVRFLHRNAVTDPIPIGEVCFLRQVLQHLSNEQISTILKKIQNFKWVFITEHLPSEEKLLKPNLDKITGSDVRVYKNSGVYLDKPPFQISPEKLFIFHETEGTDLGPDCDKGIIRTYLYSPNI